MTKQGSHFHCTPPQLKGRLRRIGQQTAHDQCTTQNNAAIIKKKLTQCQKDTFSHQSELQLGEEAHKEIDKDANLKRQKP